MYPVDAAFAKGRQLGAPHSINGLNFVFDGCTLPAQSKTKRLWERWAMIHLNRGLQIAISLVLSMMLWFSSPDGGAAATAPTQQSPVDIQVSLGNTNNELVFVPNQLQFTTGQRYRLILQNPSNQKHYFTAKDFADSIWTQKVEAGNVEIKGAIHDMELRSGASAEWVFIPLKPGTFELHCSIPGHTEAGMKGTLTIAAN